MNLPMAAAGETAVPLLLAPTHFLFDAVDSLSTKYFTDKWPGSIKGLCLPVLRAEIRSPFDKTSTIKKLTFVITLASHRLILLFVVFVTP